MMEKIEIIDVAPRDGLQSQDKIVDTDAKIELIKKLIDAGIRRMEVVSFVNPKRVPQMADAEELLKRLPAHDDVPFVHRGGRSSYFRSVNAVPNFLIKSIAGAHIDSSIGIERTPEACV